MSLLRPGIGARGPYIRLQLRVFRFKVSQPPHVVHGGARVLTPPLEERRLADRVPPQQVRDRKPRRGFFENRHDLAVAELRTVRLLDDRVIGGPDVKRWKDPESFWTGIDESIPDPVSELTDDDIRFGKLRTV